ncbi:MAG: aminotransferase class I/II-fold pyridoxal phosphate-dependent enzyme [Gallionella sp.]|jgi:CDP-6-deoxy-D-xylo-4-hexulose-3-dehydrase|nr:aminotransferase class I/II-fold pyridoxal phosphate-dependent enzyme [Gallionella sp.]
MSFIPGKDRIQYGGAMIGLEEVKAVMDVMLSNKGTRWTVGPESIAFETELATVTGVKRAVVVNSGSSALLIATAALKLPKGSKILVPACNFPTAFNAIIQNGHIPVVVDVDLSTFNISLDEVREALVQHPDIAGVIAVNIAGNPVDLIKLREIVGTRKIILDDCDGYGTTLNDKFVETYADVSCVSFHAAHIITTGEGGAVLTDDENIANRAVKLREWGRVSGTDKIYDYPGFPVDYKERYVYEEIGWNMKPLELQCAMGRVQLRRLQEFKDARRLNYHRLDKIFVNHRAFTTLGHLPNSDPCWFSFPLMVNGDNRGQIMQTFEDQNIETRTVFSGNILKHPAYKDVELIKIGDMKNADEIMKRGMFLSCHPSLTPDMIQFISDVASKI